MRDREEGQDEEIIVRSLKQPNCVKIDIKDNEINYTIEKELGIELVGDIKVKVEVDSNDDDSWDEIVEEKDIDNQVDEINQVKEDFMEETI